MITQDLNTLKFNLMSNEKFEEKQANETLVENEIYLTPAPKVDSEPVENSKNLISSGAVFEALKNIPTNGGGNAEAPIKQIQADWAQTDDTKLDYIKNKIGDIANIAKEDLRNYSIQLGNPSDTSPFILWGGLIRNISNLQDIQDGTSFKVYQNGTLIGETQLMVHAILDSQFTPEGYTGYWGLINANQTADQILTTGVWTRKNADYPTFVIGFIKDNTNNNVYINVGAPENLINQSFDLQLDFSENIEQVIGLPDNILGEEFENINGILTSTYGRTITSIIEDKKEYTSKEIGNPNATNPFPRWERICTIENQEFSEDTLVNICYTDIDEQNIQFSTKTLLNATLDEMFGFDPEEYLGYWGIVNSQQTIQEILSLGQWDKIDTSKPSIVLIVQKSLSDGTLYISFAAPELISQYATIYNIEFVNTTIEEHIIKLPTSAIPTDSQPTENSDNFLTSGTINELLNNFQGGGGVQSDWEQEDETEMDYIKNKPFFELDPVSFEPPRKFYYSWNGEDYKERPNSEGYYYKISNDIIPIEDLHDTIVTLEFLIGNNKGIWEMRQCDIWEMVSENGDIGYEIGYKDSRDGLIMEWINIIPAPGNYTSTNGVVQGPYPEAGVYFMCVGGDDALANYGTYWTYRVLEFKGPIDETQFTDNDWYYKDEENIIYLKQINTEPLTESDWFGANIGYKQYNYKAEYDIMPVEEIYNLTSRIFTPNELIIVVKNPETIDNPWNPEEKLTLQKGTYVYGDNVYQLTSYQLMKKLDKKFVPQDIAYEKITQGNTKAVSSGAVYEALGGSRIYKTSSLENDSEKLMTAKGVYDIVQMVGQELNKKQDSLEILDTVQQDSNGVVKSSGIYQAIADARPKDVSELGNEAGYQTAEQVQALIGNNITSELSSVSNQAITSSAVNSAIQEVLEVAEGKRTAHVYDTKADLDTDLLDSEFVSELKIGDVFLIKANNTPDYWWDGSNLVELETNIDLTNYYTKSEINNNYYNKTITDNRLSAKKDDNRITLKGNPSSAGYYLLGRLPYAGSSSNYASFIIKGRIGGWESDNSAYFDIMLMNRNGISSTVSAQSTSNSLTSALNNCDIVIVNDTSDSYTHPTSGQITYPMYVYLKCNNYYAFDIEYTICGNTTNANPSENIEFLYDETVAFTEEPSNIVWTLSNAPKTITYADGSFSPSGGLNGLHIKKAYSSQISNPVEGTIYYNTSDKTIQVYTGGSWSSAVSADPNTIYFVVEG